MKSYPYEKGGGCRNSFSNVEGVGEGTNSFGVVVMR